MKHILKILKWTFFMGLLIATITFCGFAYYLETSIDKVMSGEEQDELFKFINNSPPLPESFYTTIPKYVPGFLEGGVWGSMLNQLTKPGRGESCECRNLYFPAYAGRIRFSQQIVALEIDEHCTQRKCYEYRMAESYFGINVKGVEEAAKQFYNKSPEELSEKEILELNLIWKAPTNYNPLLHRNELDKAVNKLMNNQKE